MNAKENCVWRSLFVCFVFFTHTEAETAKTKTELWFRMKVGVSTVDTVRDMTTKRDEINSNLITWIYRRNHPLIQSCEHQHFNRHHKTLRKSLTHAYIKMQIVYYIHIIIYTPVGFPTCKGFEQAHKSSIQKLFARAINKYTILQYKNGHEKIQKYKTKAVGVVRSGRWNIAPIKQNFCTLHQQYITSTAALTSLNTRTNLQLTLYQYIHVYIDFIWPNRHPDHYSDSFVIGLTQKRLSTISYMLNTLSSMSYSSSLSPCKLKLKCMAPLLFQHNYVECRLKTHVAGCVCQLSKSSTLSTVTFTLSRQPQAYDPFHATFWAGYIKFQIVAHKNKHVISQRWHFTRVLMCWFCPCVETKCTRKGQTGTRCNKTQILQATLAESNQKKMNTFCQEHC